MLALKEIHELIGLLEMVHNGHLMLIVAMENGNTDLGGHTIHPEIGDRGRIQIEDLGNWLWRGKTSYQMNIFSRKKTCSEHGFINPKKEETL